MRGTLHHSRDATKREPPCGGSQAPSDRSPANVPRGVGGQNTPLGRMIPPRHEGFVQVVGLFDPPSTI
jgi:hypothetical protein